MRLVLALCLCIAITNGSPIMKREHLSSPRDGVGGIQIADQFYFAGGFEFNDYVPTKIVEIYNITSQEWEEPIYLDEPRGWISTAVIGQNVYFVGGSTYDGNCVMLYNTSIHQYSPIGCGPTVRQAIQISNHNSTVTVLGIFSADFYNASNQWYYYPTLTSWMRQISGGLKMVHENLIVGVGGVNFTTSAPLYNAWIFDTSTQNLTVFDTFTSFVDMDPNNPSFSFVSANGKIIIFTPDRFFAHEFGTTQWFELSMINAVRAVALSDVAFVFNSTGYYVYTWGTNTRDATWTPDTQTSRDNLLVFKNQLGMIRGNVLVVYQNGVVNQLPLEYYVEKIAPLGTTGFFLYINNFPFQIYDSEQQVLTVTTKGATQVKSIVPFNENKVVLFDGTQAGVFDVQALTLTMLSAQMIGEYLIGTDIVSIRSQKVFINLISVVDLSPKATPLLKSNDASAITLPISVQDYLYIDVYNYVQKQMQQEKIFINMTSAIYFSQKFGSVAVIDDMLVVMFTSAAFRYNATSGESFETLQPSLSRSASLQKFSTVSSVKVVNGVGHFPGSVPHSIFAVDGTAVTLIQKPETSVTTEQYVTSEDNVIYMSTTYSAKFQQIYTYDVSKDELQTFSLPSEQNRTIIGITNDTLIALGGDGYVYAVKLNDYTTWYQSSLRHDFVPTISYNLNNGMIMIAGGKHFKYMLYTDEILFVNASAIIEEGVQLAPQQPVSPPNELQPTATPSDGVQAPAGLTDGELVAAIVVPVVVVVAAIILLVVLLIKRRNNKKRRGGNVSSLGLESRFGAWFTPFDQITFGEQLGQGGSGQVFKGAWKNTSVALKVSMTQANTTVISELELMMQLRPHPNVVQLLGFSVHPETDSIILIIEFCEGGSLDTKLYDDRSDISLSDKVQWLLGIAKGLSHLHSNNIVHRDVAARNVLLHRNEPKLTDFGMSRLVDEQKQHGTTKSQLGPIRWMSPESLKNKEYSTKSDIWSFGILMYEVIARQEPHSEADPIEIGRLIRDSGLTPVIPPSMKYPELVELMTQCWQMSPQSRPKIETIIESLEAIK